MLVDITMPEDIGLIRRSNTMAIDTLSSSRRRFLSVASVSTAAALFGSQTLLADSADQAALPSAGALSLSKADTAVVFIDPQNDVLSEHGRAWAAVSESVKENKTIENMERIFKA